MKIFTHSAQGQRAYQEDRLLIQDSLLVIADGMGGHPNGDKAATHAVECLSAVASEVEETKGLMNTDELTRGIKNANTLCIQAGDRRGSTVSTVYIDKDTSSLQIAHVGDTRIYLMRGPNLIYRTDDHGYGHTLTNCLGFLVQVDTKVLSYQEGDILLMTTDGIHDVFDGSYHLYSEIQKAIELGFNPAEKLCSLAIDERESRDNCTAIICLL